MNLTQHAPGPPLCPPPTYTPGRRLPALAGEPWWSRDDAEHDAATSYLFPNWNVDAGNRPPRFGQGWVLDDDLNLVDTGEVEVTWRGPVPDLHSHEAWEQHHYQRGPISHEGVSLPHVYELYADSPETSRGIPKFFSKDRWTLARIGIEELSRLLCTHYDGLSNSNPRTLARIVLRLVGKLTRRHRDLDREEVVAACLESLVRSSQRWTPTGGATFTTYAYTAMRHAVADLYPATDDDGQPVEVETVAAGDTRHAVGVAAAPEDAEELALAPPQRGHKRASLPPDVAADLNLEANCEAWHTTGSEQPAPPPPDALPDHESRQPGSDHHLAWLDLVATLQDATDGDLVFERDLLDQPVAQIAARRGLARQTISNRLTPARQLVTRRNPCWKSPTNPRQTETPVERIAGS